MMVCSYRRNMFINNTMSNDSGFHGGGKGRKKGGLTRFPGPISARGQVRGKRKGWEEQFLPKTASGVCPFRRRPAKKTDAKKKPKNRGKENTATQKGKRERTAQTISGSEGDTGGGCSRKGENPTAEAVCRRKMENHGGKLRR